jgi:hypothetical protein
VERVDLRKVRHAERQRWRSGDEWDRRATKIAVGELPDGRWYVRCYDGLTPGPEPLARVYGPKHGEHYARGTARRWMRTFGGTWVEA